jgi:hypothetical protein
MTIDEAADLYPDAEMLRMGDGTPCFLTRGE